MEADERASEPTRPAFARSERPVLRRGKAARKKTRTSAAKRVIMTRIIATVLYWLAAVTIALGAFGHGFLGVKPVEAAVAASTLPADIVGVIWIVWYFVSGTMIVCGSILFWAWPAINAGSTARSGAAYIIGVFYAATGVACYLYSGREPFWLLFFFQGVIVIGTTAVLSSMRSQR